MLAVRWATWGYHYFIMALLIFSTFFWANEAIIHARAVDQAKLLFTIGPCTNNLLMAFLLSHGRGQFNQDTSNNSMARLTMLVVRANTKDEVWLKKVTRALVRKGLFMVCVLTIGSIISMYAIGIADKWPLSMHAIAWISLWYGWGIGYTTFTRVCMWANLFRFGISRQTLNIVTGTLPFAVAKQRWV